MAKDRQRRPELATSPYTSRIIKAGALLSDTKTLLRHWDVSGSVSANLDRVQRENLFGKASRSRVKDILAVFRRRFLEEPEVLAALVVLVQRRCAAASLDRILYFHAANADRLLHDAVTEVLLPMRQKGVADVRRTDFQKALLRCIKEKSGPTGWSDYTTSRVTQGLMAALRDFGVLQGSVNKRLAPTYIPVPAFAYIAFYLKMHHHSGAKVLENPDWRLFFLDRDAVERLFVEANQYGLLEYHAAGSVTRLTFPRTTLQEYAHVVAQG